MSTAVPMVRGQHADALRAARDVHALLAVSRDIPDCDPAWDVYADSLRRLRFKERRSSPRRPAGMGL